MPFSASPKPAPSSASPSGIISVPDWAAPIPAPSPTSRNSSARRSRAPNRPDFCPYYAKTTSVFDLYLGGRSFRPSSCADFLGPVHAVMRRCLDRLERYSATVVIRPHFGAKAWGLVTLREG